MILILWHNRDIVLYQGAVANPPYTQMKLSRKVPLVHLGRLRASAQAAGCVGVLACIDQMSKAFLTRKSMVRDELIARTPILKSETKDPALDAALEELDAVVEAKYGEREKQIEAEFAHEDGDDCTAIPRALIYWAEIVPTLRPEARGPLDRMFGEMARDQLAA